MSRPNPFADFLSATVSPSEPKEQKTTYAYENSVRVPNIHPRVPPSSIRLALIGEAPGESEEHHLVPFCPLRTPDNPYSGASGRFLNVKLSQAGIVRDQCLVANVCQVRPPDNKIDAFAYDGPEIRSGLEQLQKDLQEFNPNLCVLLGKTALWAAKGTTNVSDWRGSLFMGQGVFEGRKCLATFHPAACLRQYEWTPLILFDLKKAQRNASTPDLVLPERTLLTDLSFNDLINELDLVLREKPEIAVDIEGGLGTMTCVAIATSATRAFIVPFARLNGASYWPTETEEVEIWTRFAAIMADREIKKCFQNGLYDRFVLQHGYSVVVRGCQDDTMLKFSEMYCELEKSLGFQCSVLTDEPYYKFERKVDDSQTHYRYCCKDAATTFEINKKLDRLLDAGQREHYRRNHDLLNPLLRMELRGIHYGRSEAVRRLEEVNADVYTLQHKLDTIAGMGFQALPSIDYVRSIMCYKRNPEQPKADYMGIYLKCINLIRDNATSERALGFLSIACKRSLNLKSPVFKTYLYDTLKLPKQYKVDPRTKEKRLSTDYEALLHLSKCSHHPAVQLAIELGMLRTRSQMLEIGADEDGRIRCGYNIVGTETGRITCYTSPTGSGYNLQTIPKENFLRPATDPLRAGMRDLFISDPDCYIFECDLSGADGWTVGAYLASLGDRTMLDDLLAELKPARVVCYMLRHGPMSLHGKGRDEIKHLIEEVKKDDWDYFACKVGIWGTCYTMGPKKLASVFLQASEGALDWDQSKTKEFQDIVKTRYNLRLWHDWAQRQIARDPVILAPNGFRRRFFGRPQEILGEYLAHLPQVITTYATNTAMYRLWTDPENRLADGRLVVEPLHQVHDALLGQFPRDRATWAVDKIKSWFNNPLIIAGQKISIPFEGAFGTNWALDKNSKVGTI